MKPTNFTTALLLIFITFIAFGCNVPPESQTSIADEEPVVLDEGSTSQNPDYFVDETGRVIYTETREVIEGSEPAAEERNPMLPPIFSGSQRIYPTGEDPEFRESYITRASFDVVEHFYTFYLETGSLDPDVESNEPAAILNAITSADTDGRRQAALFINYDNVRQGEPRDNPRAGMKVLLKEYPDQHAVQIILTTLEETPLGLSPVGIWITPEEAEQLANEAAERVIQQQRIREAMEEQVEENEEEGEEVEEGESSGE